MSVPAAPESALQDEIKRLIAADGPLGIDRYMELCLSHPVYGYYRMRDPFGASGDFITAPEVSQMFGELIGVWCVEAWDAIGRPGAVQIVELGPGRGTLMADVTRVLGSIKSFAAAVEVHLVETGPLLRQCQKQTLGAQAGSVTWHETLGTVPPGPAITIANEFFDALPVRQFERRSGAWFERVVGLDDAGELALGLAPEAIDTAHLELPAISAGDGDVWEHSTARRDVARMLGSRIAADGGAGLLIDYGHLASGFGDSVQAVRDHKPVALVHAPGHSDLTSHVDFEALAGALAADGNTVSAAITQREFLNAMGLEARVGGLKQNADEATARDIDLAAARLRDCDQMGNLFKVCAVTGPGARPAYPFGETQR